MVTRSLLFTEKYYSPFCDYFGLAEVIQRINSPASPNFSDTASESSSNLTEPERDFVFSDVSSSPERKLGSKLNPFATPFSPFAHAPPQSPGFAVNPPAPDGSLCAVNSELRFKLRVQRCRAAQNKDRYRKVKFCVFCRKSGQSEHIQSSHVLKREDGRVCCPYLRAYVCPTCGATGDDAHTIKYCPATQPKIIFT